MTHDPIAPLAAFAALGRVKLSETSLDDVLTRVVAAAQQALPGVADVSITLVRQDGPFTAACTGELALALDERQYEHHRGPCLQAAAEHRTISVPDTASDTRWAGWAPRAAAANAYAYHNTADLARQMRQAMESRAMIEQAKGIIMAEQRCSPDDAFALLTRISQKSNRKLRDVAAALVAGVERSPGPKLS